MKICKLKRNNDKHGGFTLIEMLVVISIITILIAIILPVLGRAKSSARKIVCMANLRQIGTAINTYSMDHDESIPIGPKAPPFLSPADFYPSTGTPTSLISLSTGQPAGLGLLLAKYLSKKSEVLFCPGADQSVSTKAELAKVGKNQAQCSYYYRHASVTSLFDNPKEAPIIDIKLSNLGLNRKKQKIKALVLDTQFLCPDDLANFNVKPRTHHDLKTVNIFFAGGHVVSRKNEDNRFTVDVRDYADIRNAFSKILETFEEADKEQ